MLSCGKVIGQLSKISRHVNAASLHKSSKYEGFASIASLRFSSSSTKKPSKPVGKTATVKECAPKVPDTKGKNDTAPCERLGYSCPPACEQQPVCNVQQGNASTPKGSGGDGWKNSKFWKPLLAVFLLTGVTIFVTSQLGGKTAKDVDSAKKVKKKKDVAKKVKSPANSSAIPSEVPYLLIGGGTAAFSAFRSIKSKDPKAKVLVVSEERGLPYMRPPLSKELWFNKDKDPEMPLVFRQWNGTRRSLFYEPPEFYTSLDNLTLEKGGVSVATGWKVKKVDVMRKVAILDDGYEIKYDKCLIATGSTPKNLPVFESASDEVKDKIIPYRTIEHFLELEANLNSPEIKNIVIIGGGFLGSELACSLSRNLNKDKTKIYQIFKEKSVMAQVLPDYLSEWTTDKVKAEGVHCIPDAEVKDYVYKDGKLSLVLTGDRIIDADQVVVAVGVKANTELANESDLETNPEIGGYLVNAELEARSNLWVAGDAACFYDVRLGRRRVEHHDHAVVSGRLAGENMTGAGKPYLHQSMFWSDLGPEIGYEAIGIVDSTLPTVSIFAKVPEKDCTKSTSSEKDSESTNTIVEAKNQLARQSQGEATPEKQVDYDRGVVFYLRNDMVVGIVLWNIFNRMSIARQVLAQGFKYDDLNEVAKLFAIHED